MNESSSSSENNNIQNEPPTKKIKTIDNSCMDMKNITYSNPLQTKKEEFIQSIPEDKRQNFFCNKTVTPEQRAELWMKQADYGEELVNSYSWATPDERAINIIKYFSPIIEIGCGKNAYWATILNQCGVDIIAYDCDVDSGGLIEKTSSSSSSTTTTTTTTMDILSSSNTIDATDFKQQHSNIIVRKGGPQILLEEDIIKSNRTLMLCYPDEDEDDNDNDNDNDNENENDNENLEKIQDEFSPSSLGIKCLEYFQGDYIIHIGELFADTLSMEQAPWGRSSSAQFQERLAGEYHCLLRASIPNWLHVRDTISVWKRSQRCSIVFQGNEESNDSHKDNNEDINEDEDEEVDYKHIPVAERLPVDIAAPCVEHLLQKKSN